LSSSLISLSQNTRSHSCFHSDSRLSAWFADGAMLPPCMMVSRGASSTPWNTRLSSRMLNT